MTQILSARDVDLGDYIVEHGSTVVGAASVAGEYRFALASGERVSYQPADEVVIE